MIELSIPGRGLIELEHLVCDVNGTLALDGQLLDGVARALTDLRDRLQLHLVTANTHGRQELIDQQLNVKAVRLQTGEESQQAETSPSGGRASNCYRSRRERRRHAGMCPSGYLRPLG
jgi:soluble P-type ATPase